MADNESSRDFDDFLSDDDFVSDVEIELTDSDLPAELDSDDQAILDQIEKLSNKKPSWLNAILVLVISAGVFTAVAATSWDWTFTLILIPVLLFHELGHALAMVIFKYRNVRMFFIPFFGAAVTGHKYNIAGWKRAIVSLAGPLPGIALGVAVGIAGMIAKTTAPDWPWELMLKVALFLLMLNGLNLLPVLPLDGGRMLHSVLFVRHVALDILFRIAAAIALFAGAATLGDKIGYFLAALVVIGIPGAYINSKVAKKVRDRGYPADAPDGEKIPTQTALAIVDELRIAYPRGIKNNTAATLTLQVFEQMNARPPGIGGTFAIGTVYVLSLAVTVVATSLFVVGRHMDLGQLQADVLTEPQWPLSCNESRAVNGKEFSGAPTDKEITIVANFDSRKDAEQAFDKLSPNIPTKFQATLFGQTILLSIPVEDEASREEWFATLERHAKDVFVNSDKLKANLTLVCLAPTESVAEEIRDDVNRYSQVSRKAWLLAPWDPEHVMTEKHRLARRTFAEMEHSDGRFDAYDDPRVDRMYKKIAAARRRGDQKKVAEQRAELEKFVKEARSAYVESFRKKGPTEADQDVVELYAARPQFDEYVEEYEDQGEGVNPREDFDVKALDDFHRRLGAISGQLPLQNDVPSPADLRYTSGGGHATNNSLRLRFNWIDFERPGDGLVAFSNWLCEKGCVGFKYEVRDPTK